MKLLITNLSNRGSKNNYRRRLGYFLEYYGLIRQVIVLRKSSSCVAIVEFVDERDAEKCLEKPVVLDGKTLKIQKYTGKS